jgi:pimeloyl-ACP methyl ester carboxylesterase
MKTSESLFFDVRGLRYHVRRWGTPGAPRLVMLHGWMDVSASFQFVVDSLRGEWEVFAPDWRGFGLTAWSGVDSYWYPDYLADLDQLLDHICGEESAWLVGHSMGGNIACIYAGVRPQRIARLVNLEGLGMRDNDPRDAPGRYESWLQELRQEQRLRDYASFEELARRLMKNNPRLIEARALFLAQHWGEALPDGGVRLRFDPVHKRVNPVLYRGAEVAACLARISAPVLWVQGAQSELGARFRLHADELEARKKSIARFQPATIEEAGHMLHHDQPESVAAAIEAFMARDKIIP